MWGVLAGVAAKPHIMEDQAPGTIGGTYGAGPLGAAAAVATLQVLVLVTALVWVTGDMCMGQWDLQGMPGSACCCRVCSSAQRQRVAQDEG